MADPVGLTQVAVRDLPLMADIGINAEEVGRRQPLLVSVTVTIDPVAADAIAATIDYRWIAQAAAALAEQRIGLIEIFARRLALQCLTVGMVRRVDVTIDKPRALPAGTASVSVVLDADGADRRCMGDRHVMAAAR